MSDIASLFQARYGISEDPGLPAVANPTLQTVLGHKSVRQFLPEKLPDGALEILIAAGQSAATSSNLQTWSVVAIQDEERKDKAAALCANQDFIRQAPLFLIFCADLSRLKNLSQDEQKPAEGLEYTEMFLMASLDAAFAAQNVSVAAESLGLGNCYVGAARNNPRELAALLGLPDRVIAVFGLAVGKPNPEKPASVKPRLPQKEVLHLETWSNGPQKDHLAEYDETLGKFNAAEQRADAPKWTHRSAIRVATQESLSGRHILRQVLGERGFSLR